MCCSCYHKEHPTEIVRVKPLIFPEDKVLLDKTTSWMRYSVLLEVATASIRDEMSKYSYATDFIDHVCERAPKEYIRTTAHAQGPDEYIRDVVPFYWMLYDTKK
jgi:hypothetical protein